MASDVASAGARVDKIVADRRSGLHVANRSVFITLASILHVFDLRELSDEPIDTLLVTNAVNSGPTEALKIDFRPRFAGSVDLARSAVASTEGV